MNKKSCLELIKYIALPYIALIISTSTFAWTNQTTGIDLFSGIFDQASIEAYATGGGGGGVTVGSQCDGTNALGFRVEYSTDNGLSFSGIPPVTINQFETIKVRLSYCNIAAGDMSGVYIQANLPTTGLTQIGDITNSWGCDSNNQNCFATKPLPGVTVNDLNLALHPQAGFFGYANNASNGTLEMGKHRYIRVARCDPSPSSPTTPSRYSIIDASDTENSGLISLTQCGQIFGGTDSDYSSVITYNLPTYTNRYLYQALCVGPDVGGNYGLNNLDITNDPDVASSNPNCANYFAGGATFNSQGYTQFDTIGKRYLNVLRCDDNTGLAQTSPNSRYTLIQSVNATFLGPYSCGSFFGGPDTNYQPSTGYSVDLLNSLRGYGYLEVDLQATGDPGFLSSPWTSSILNTSEGGYATTNHGYTLEILATGSGCTPGTGSGGGPGLTDTASLVVCITGGTLTLNTPETANFNSVQVAASETLTAGILTPVVIEDLRGSYAGWSASCTMTNLAGATLNTYIIPLASEISGGTSKFSITPTSLIISPGASGNLAQGLTDYTSTQSTLTVTTMGSDGVSNSFDLASFATESGQGRYQKSLNMEIAVPPFLYTQNYLGTMTCSLS